MSGKPGRRGFGHIRKLPSGRLQASYVAPDLRRHTAPTTFTTRMDAEAWLAAERRIIERDDWTAPKTRQKRSRAITLGDYWPSWLDNRPRPLKPSTRERYQEIWQLRIAPTFGGMRLVDVTRPAVEAWYRGLDTGPTAKARAYGLLHAVLATAVDDELIEVNPARIKRAMTAKRVRQIRPATIDELTVIAANMRDERFRTFVLTAAWLALRYGETVELRRRDVDLHGGTVRVERAAQIIAGRWVVDTPKAESVRTVTIPPHLTPVLRAHLDTIGQHPDALLFPSQRDPGRHLHPDVIGEQFKRARAIAGRDDLTLHGLRHTGATLAAQTGATLAELMERLGHSTPSAALRYQHSAKGRQAAIAAALSTIATTRQQGDLRHSHD